MSFRNLNIRPKLVALALTGALATVTLTGCKDNEDLFLPNLYYNKAIIFGDKTATVIYVKEWFDMGDEYKITTNDGAVFTSSTFDTKLINDSESEITAEDMIIAIMGKDVQINYLGDQSTDTKTK